MNLSTWLETQLKDKSWTIDDLVYESKLYEEKKLDKEKYELIKQLNMQKLTPDVLKLKISNIEADILKRKVNAGLGRATIFRIKNGKSKASKKTIEKLGRVFKKPVELSHTPYIKSRYEEIYRSCEICNKDSIDENDAYHQVFISLHKYKLNIASSNKNNCHINMCDDCFGKGSFLLERTYKQVLQEVLDLPKYSIETLALQLEVHKVVLKRILKEETNYININTAKTLHLLIIEHYLYGDSTRIIKQNCKVFTPFFNAVRGYGYEFYDGSKSKQKELLIKRNRGVIKQIFKYADKQETDLIEIKHGSYNFAFDKNGKRYIPREKALLKLDFRDHKTFMGFCNNTGFFHNNTPYFDFGAFHEFRRSKGVLDALLLASGEIHLNYNKRVLNLGTIVSSSNHIIYQCSIYLRRFKHKENTACFVVESQKVRDKQVDYFDMAYVAGKLGATNVCIIQLDQDESGNEKICSIGFYNVNNIRFGDIFTKSELQPAMFSVEAFKKADNTNS